MSYRTTPAFMRSDERPDRLFAQNMVVLIAYDSQGKKHIVDYLASLHAVRKAESIRACIHTTHLGQPVDAITCHECQGRGWKRLAPGADLLI